LISIKKPLPTGTEIKPVIALNLAIRFIEQQARGTQDMLPVYIASGIMVLAGLCAGYVGAKNLHIDRTVD